MPRFLAVYTMRPEDLDAWHRLPEAEQKARDAAGLKRWTAWSEANAAAVVCPDGMVGRTRRVTAEGAAEVRNGIAGYTIVEADTLEEAAALFENHPHFTVFPGDGVDVMPLLTGPGADKP